MGRPKYTCEGCGKTFARWQAISTVAYKQVFHEDSLQWHLIQNEDCNDANVNYMISLRPAPEYVEGIGYIH